MHWVKQKRENEGCDVTTVMIMLGQVCSCNWTNSGVSGYLWMVLGTSPKVAMDGRLYNQLCLLCSFDSCCGFSRPHDQSDQQLDC